MALARKFPFMSFVVQDMEPVIEEAKKNVPSDVADRIEFMVHDFFEVQPVIGAAVYFFRWIFHNWPDKYCIKILKSLIPSLRRGSKVMISEAILPGPGEIPSGLEGRLRSFDLVMTSIQNARERELDDWIALFRESDARFEFAGVTRPPGSNHSLIGAVWKGD